MKNMYVLLIHGTWAGAGRWTHADSSFRKKLEDGLKNLDYDCRFETFPWNGRNRWSSRAAVAKAVNDHLDKVKSERDGEWEFLVVAHSHGGNIATEAVRAGLRDNPDLPIRGVVCLNSPFLTHEVRGSCAYLLVWLLFAVVLAASLLSTGGLDGNLNLSESELLAKYIGGSIRTFNVLVALSLEALFIALLLFLSRQRQKHQQEYSWGPRPNVLCLSCPDDEAITFLGLGEGVANLPQLLLHPMAIVLVLTAVITVLNASGHFGWCGQEIQCWENQLMRVSLSFAIWIGVALIGGMLGACFVTLIFGLSLKQAFNALVSRVLVSYAPLRPAQSYFRGISELPLKWGSPLQLFHSGIYESPQSVDEICEWLKEHAHK